MLYNTYIYMRYLYIVLLDHVYLGINVDHLNIYCQAYDSAQYR